MPIDSTNLSSIALAQIWQIGVLSLAVGGVNLVAGRRWPHLAYALWLVVLTKCFVPPIGSWPLNLLGRATPAAMIVLAQDTERVGSGSTSFTARSGKETDESSPATVPRIAYAPNSNDRIGSIGSRTDIGNLAAMTWLFGSALYCGIAIGRGGGVARRLRASSRPLPAAAQSIADGVARRLELRPGARVRVTPMDVGPVVIGIWQPTVFIPEMLLDHMQPRRLEAMLAHELAHVRRRDTWVAAAQFAAHALWWFHPAVWWMNRELIRQRERCCDEEAVANLDGRRQDYASCLVDVLEARQRLEPLWGYPAVRTVELTRRRLEEIMKRKNMTHVRMPRWCGITALLLAVVVLPSAAPSAPAQKDDGTNPRSETVSPKDSATAETPAVLKYGDGKADGKKSYGGSGQLIRFELPKGVQAIRGIRIHGSRYGLPQAPNENFEITFLNEDRSETLDTVEAPYRLFKRGKESWVRVLFDKEIELPPVFWISLNFNAQQTKGVYVSYDTSTKGKYSLVGLPGDDEEPKETDFKGDWMVQVLLSRPGR